MLTSKALVRFIQLKIFAVSIPGGTVRCKLCGVRVFGIIKRYGKIKMYHYPSMQTIGTPTLSVRSVVLFVTSFSQLNTAITLAA